MLHTVLSNHLTMAYLPENKHVPWKGTMLKGIWAVKKKGVTFQFDRDPYNDLL